LACAAVRRQKGEPAGWCTQRRAGWRVMPRSSPFPQINRCTWGKAGEWGLLCATKTSEVREASDVFLG
jgi:hypothetical protein